MRRVVLSLSVLVTLLFAYMAPALACSCAVFGANDLRVGDVLPEDAVGVYWLHVNRIDTEGVDNTPLAMLDDRVTLERWDGAAYVEIPHVLSGTTELNSWIVPGDRAWAVGERYRVTTTGLTSTNYELADAVAEFEVGDAIAQDAALDISVTEVQGGVLSIPDGASCSREAELIYADVSVTGGDLAGLEDSLFFELLVDGEPMKMSDGLCEPSTRGHLSQGQLVGRVAASCDGVSFGVVEPGMHVVKVRAYLPGAQASWESAAKEIELECGAGGLASGCAVGGAGRVGDLSLLLFGLAAFGLRRNKQSGKARGGR